MAKRDYRTVICKGMVSLAVDYVPGDDSVTPNIPAKKAILYFGDGDTETKRAFVMLLPGGGGTLGSMRSTAQKFTEVGYVCGEFEPGEGSEFDQIAHGGCFNRFLHKYKAAYGIAGGKVFGFGISLGGAIVWGMNICLDRILTDRQFISPVNDLYPKAKMKLLGTASMPGDIDDSIYPMIDASCVKHLDSHGDGDEILPYKKAVAAIDQMNKFVPGSRLDTYEKAGHGLDGLHEIIMGKTIEFFAGLMGIPPTDTTVTTPI